ncbi:hypothetical protein LshimejAT787_5400030 [Lyophyllum shimeji]|uniref:Uncharacterized protein n=1 Tax=Lyophyllum shimeji TaxID=47721 RepID=A0A9P3Q3I6_LYOSH|nr:hypothetical protein LshimejAT787_5400030 [Lyophyllum shimeji]
MSDVTIPHDDLSLLFVHRGPSFCRFIHIIKSLTRCMVPSARFSTPPTNNQSSRRSCNRDLCQTFSLQDGDPQVVPSKLSKPFINQTLVVLVARFRDIDGPEKILECDVVWTRGKLIDRWRGLQRRAVAALVCLQVKGRSIEKEAQDTREIDNVKFEA